MSKVDPSKAAPTPDADASAEQNVPGADLAVDTPSPAPAHFRVNFPFGLNLRAAPDRRGAILKVLPCGADVEVSGDPVAIGDTVWRQTDKGWVDSRYLIEA